MTIKMLNKYWKPLKIMDEQCREELINALEGLVASLCTNGNVKSINELTSSLVKNTKCRNEVTEVIGKVIRGELGELNEPILSNYLLYIRPRVSDGLRNLLRTILPMINGGNIDDALGRLMSGACELPINDLVYAVDLARLLTLAKYDKSLIDAALCRIRLIMRD